MTRRDSMPVKKVKGGYKWGTKGKTYPTKAQAEKQGRAAYANGYKGGGEKSSSKSKKTTKKKDSGKYR